MQIQQFLRQYNVSYTCVSVRLSKIIPFCYYCLKKRNNGKRWIKMYFGFLVKTRFFAKNVLFLFILFLQVRSPERRKWTYVNVNWRQKNAFSELINCYINGFVFIFFSIWQKKVIVLEFSLKVFMIIEPRKFNQKLVQNFEQE